MATSSRGKLIAIDGKTLRRSFKQAGDHAFVHMVSAWSHANQVVLGQVKVDDKSNEVTAIPALLDLIDIREALVTIDAAGTQTDVAEKIVDKGGDYLLALKDNQPMLHAAVTIHFDEHSKRRALDTHVTDDKAHGREETRRAWVSSTIAGIESAERWKGLTTVIVSASRRRVAEARAHAHAVGHDESSGVGATSHGVAGERQERAGVLPGPRVSGQGPSVVVEPSAT
jgi:predicted transposase YbfD/YdcC